ncbi:MAG: response regulator [Chloroflexota bacterium]|nr:response regulator [Chloroflexota bacterium]
MSQHKILIIDDDDTYRSVINDVLTESGYLVVEARSGMDGLEQARKEVPDVILLDIMMPVMDGYQTCRELRRNPSTRGIPIVMLTALTDSEAQFKSKEAGADDYIAKPYPPREMKNRIDRQLRRRALQRKPRR